MKAPKRCSCARALSHPCYCPPPLSPCASAPPHLDPQVLSYAELIEHHPELKPSQDRVVYKEAFFTDMTHKFR